MKTPFWLVCNLKRNMPVHKHNTKALAEQEAARLSKLQPADTFYVLKPVSLTTTKIEATTTLSQLRDVKK